MWFRAGTWGRHDCSGGLRAEHVSPDGAKAMSAGDNRWGAQNGRTGFFHRTLARFFKKRVRQKVPNKASFFRGRSAVVGELSILCRIGQDQLAALWLLHSRNPHGHEIGSFHAPVRKGFYSAGARIPWSA